MMISSSLSPIDAPVIFDISDEIEGESLPISVDPTRLETPDGFRSGFVALVGRPNVGKSTLLNQLMGQKIAICSPVMQTTRHRIRGVMTRPDAQLVILDTPGFSKPIDALGTFLVKEGYAALKEADVLFCVMDITSPPGRGDAWIVEQALSTKRPVYLILNKVDRLTGNPALYEERSKAYQQLFLTAKGIYKRCLHTSAKTGKQKNVLTEAMFESLPKGPKYYEDDTLTDQRLREMVAELVREQVLLNTQDEIPHSVAIGVDVFDETHEKMPHLYVTLYVNRKSQRGMLIGKAGTMIRLIGERARLKIERLLGEQVFLKLDVKVKENWRKDVKFLQGLNLALPQ
ncbi:MAG: GTPase Era [Vampirovibrio sp.]|jgi:GTP-binding protein Era